VGTLLIAGGGSGVLLLAGERFGALAFASINAISLAFWALLRGPMNELLRAQTNAQAAAGWALTILWSASVVALYLLGYSSLATAIVIVTGLAFLLSAWFIAYGPLHELQNESPRDHDRDQQDD
jgi:HAMP domain-containing protein